MVSTPSEFNTFEVMSHAMTVKEIVAIEKKRLLALIADASEKEDEQKVVELSKKLESLNLVRQQKELLEMQVIDLIQRESKFEGMKKTPLSYAAAASAPAAAGASSVAASFIAPDVRNVAVRPQHPIASKKNPHYNEVEVNCSNGCGESVFGVVPARVICADPVKRFRLIGINLVESNEENFRRVISLTFGKHGKGHTGYHLNCRNE